LIYFLSPLYQFLSSWNPSGALIFDPKALIRITKFCYLSQKNQIRLLVEMHGKRAEKSDLLFKIKKQKNEETERK
jgi:hypothetical protein